MKKLTVGVCAILMLATQLKAQQQPSVSVTTSGNGKSVTTTTSSSYAYTNTDVKNSVNVRYGDGSNNDNVQDDTPMKAKSFTKSFGIDRSDKISLNNQFGSITIKTWDKNEIKVDIDMKAYAKTAEEAQKLIDDVSISATKSGDLVSYKTETEIVMAIGAAALKTEKQFGVGKLRFIIPFICLLIILYQHRSNMVTLPWAILPDQHL
ncbi:MAG: hypothetical protein EOO93_10240 [Pedobacter sp.]|nr:MAG: hypothetical protein EOO93_10240 [Pedobacter sp.]